MSSVGLLLLAFGLGSLLDALGIIEFDWGDWWGLILLIPGLVAVTSRGPRHRSGWLLVLLGALALADRLAGLPASVWRLLWPTLLIGVGLYMVLRRPRFDTVVNREQGGQIDVVTVFSEHRGMIGEPFRGGDIVAVFGGATIDLRRAELPPGGAALDCAALFANVELLVPADWKVTLDGLPIFGSVEDRRPAPPGGRPADGPALAVRGIGLFGNVVVRD